MVHTLLNLNGCNPYILLIDNGKVCLGQLSCGYGLDIFKFDRLVYLVGSIGIDYTSC